MSGETSLERIERLAYAAASPSPDDIARLTRERDEARDQIGRLEANLLTCARSAFYAGYSEGVTRGVAACTDDEDDETVDIEGAWQKSASQHIAKLGINDAKRAR